MGVRITCTQCGSLYPDFGTPHKCACGGFYNYEVFPAYKPGKAISQVRGMWRYADSFGLPSNAPCVTLGEGSTPLIQTEFNQHKVFLKMENQNPTGSYKDRGTAVLTSFLLSRGVTEAVEDSSGNAGASFAAYAALAGIRAHIYAPLSTSGPKRTQIEMYGADLILVPGPRSAATDAVLQAVTGGSAYASHAYMPFGLTGIATIAYEIVESLGKEPGTLIAPVGHGGLFYGIMLGFESLLAGGLISRLPQFLGIQPWNCSPLVQAFRDKKLQVSPVVMEQTIAEGTSVSVPSRAGAILKRMNAGMGSLLSATEVEIRDAYSMLAKKGIYCEPTSSLSLTPLLDDKIRIVEPVVAVMTGSGLKTNFSMK